MEQAIAAGDGDALLLTSTLVDLIGLRNARDALSDVAAHLSAFTYSHPFEIDVLATSNLSLIGPLPPELTQVILSFFDVDDLAHLSAISKAFYNAVLADALWLPHLANLHKHSFFEDQHFGDITVRDRYRLASSALKCRELKSLLLYSGKIQFAVRAFGRRLRSEGEIRSFQIADFQIEDHQISNFEYSRASLSIPREHLKSIEVGVVSLVRPDHLHPLRKSFEPLYCFDIVPDRDSYHLEVPISKASSSKVDLIVTEEEGSVKVELSISQIFNHVLLWRSCLTALKESLRLTRISHDEMTDILAQSKARVRDGNIEQLEDSEEEEEEEDTLLSKATAMSKRIMQSVASSEFATLVDILSSSDPALQEFLRKLHQMLSGSSSLPKWPASKKFLQRKETVSDIFYFTSVLGRKRGVRTLLFFLEVLSTKNLALLLEVEASLESESTALEAVIDWLVAMRKYVVAVSIVQWTWELDALTTDLEVFEEWIAALELRRSSLQDESETQIDYNLMQMMMPQHGGGYEEEENFAPDDEIDYIFRDD